MTRIYPVIHHVNPRLTKSEANLAFFCGADGIFLISHDGRDKDLMPLAKAIAKKHPTRQVGVNLLGASFNTAYVLALHAGIHMLWTDNPYISSGNIGSIAAAISRDLQKDDSRLEIFASVAFKYQPDEPDPPAAAAAAARLGFVPTTSGPGTGVPPDLDKIHSMRAAAGTRLAIASGMTPENVKDFIPHATDILVSTGVSNSAGRFDPRRLLALIDAAHRTSS